MEGLNVQTSVVSSAHYGERCVVIFVVVVVIVLENGGRQTKGIGGPPLRAVERRVKASHRLQLLTDWYRFFLVLIVVVFVIVVFLRDGQNLYTGRCGGGYDESKF